MHDGANPSGKMVYDQSVDVWGLGIVGCMLVTGVHPLRGLTTWQEFLDAMQERRPTERLLTTHSPLPTPHPPPPTPHPPLPTPHH